MSEKVKRLTPSERLIWAAVFSKEHNIHNPPSWVFKDTDKWQEWENSQTVAAIECAGNAIINLREAYETVKDGFEGFDILVFYKQMVSY